MPDPELRLVVDASISWVGIFAVGNLKASLDNHLLGVIDGEWECDLPKYSPKYPSSSSFNYSSPWVVPVRLQDLPVCWANVAETGWVLYTYI